MAKILPFKAWRYHSSLDNDIEKLTSPLFDVVSSRQRDKLYNNPINSIHISLPKSKNPSQEAKRTLEKWKRNGIIQQDQLPGIYVYYQYFRLPESEEEFCRKGFIVLIQTYDWDKKVILRHENTITDSVSDRLEMLNKTEFHSSPTHGLYEDPEFVLEKYMDQAIQNPLYDLEDYQGIREVMAVITDGDILRKFVQFMDNRDIILADGHHRYEASIAFKKIKSMENPNHKGTEGYNFHLMYLSNSLTRGLKVLPTHRLFFGLEIKQKEIVEKIKQFFTIRELDDPQEIGELILNKKWAFGLVFQNSAYKIVLKPESMKMIPENVPQIVSEQDVWILHYFFIEKILGIKQENQGHSKKISYEKNLSRCHILVGRGEADLACITKGVKINDIFDIVECGYTMPQKSTYFYPKAIVGLVFASVRKEEFQFSNELSR